MLFAAIGNVRDLIEISVTAISVMGGVMAYYSGAAARRAAAAEVPPWELANEVNLGLARGFDLGLPAAAIVAILLSVF